jgi:hypothetical protein
MEGLSSKVLEDESLVQCWLTRSSTASSLGILVCGDVNAPSRALSGPLASVLLALQAQLTLADLRFAPEGWFSLMRG